MEASQHPSGTVTWLDLSTTDIRDAAGFYHELLGWEFVAERTPAGLHVVGEVDHHAVAGMMDSVEFEGGGGVARWTVFFRVERLEDSIGVAVSQGGAVRLGPVESGENVRVALIEDPSGAVFGMIEHAPDRGMEPVDHAGGFVAAELHTDHLEVADFYEGVFNWIVVREAEGQSLIFGRPGESVAGLVADSRSPRRVGSPTSRSATSTRHCSGPIGSVGPSWRSPPTTIPPVPSSATPKAPSSASVITSGCWPLAIGCWASRVSLRSTLTYSCRLSFGIRWLIPDSRWHAAPTPSVQPVRDGRRESVFCVPCSGERQRAWAVRPFSRHRRAAYPAGMEHHHQIIDDLRQPTRDLRDTIPEVWQGFAALHKAAVADGALPAHVKELMAMAIGLAHGCDGCIAYHAKAATRKGATEQEAAEAIGVALLMAGGPASVEGPGALEAFKAFKADTEALADSTRS